ncbi:aromatic ring-hydroxylating dioxygenase subunit alpha [Paraburkholderia dipogonis]|uniref:Aromatic ring-hydroxylating dioxygenase subunit alpha n=1 Tax=Paraburkholderia dipogonis TaxID=1211383 RepID=A0A4Y8MVH4_9BURK|nr:aromatic ring-hydroxylating dioxygenase subunit alpha [Paraburkholderia dipogonis]TFE41550.1 aromatic ring-hydroxylating dioxygenase subunit alpha [Paraburkholderia dipogonis]
MAQNWLHANLPHHPPEWLASSDNIDPGNPCKPPEYRTLVPLSRPEALYDLGSNAETWKYFWHVAATVKEFRSHAHGAKGPMSTMLLGERIVIADLGGRICAFDDRCAHRGASLGLGWIEGDELRCRYHGWCYNSAGKCTDIPSQQEGDAIPARAKLKEYECEVKYDLIWVRLKSGADTTIPHFPAWDASDMTCHAGEPYLWPSSAGRRIENFIDVTHFAYGHQGTLGGPPHTRFKPYPVTQTKKRLEFMVDTFLAFNPGDTTYGPPSGPESKMLGPAKYHVHMPFTVLLFFRWSESRDTQIFMHATPIDAENCRSYWFTCHTSDNSSTEEHLALQSIVLTEDLPLVASHRPRAIGESHEEVSVPADKPDIIWRKWVREIAIAAKDGPEALNRVLNEESEY